MGGVFVLMRSERTRANRSMNLAEFLALRVPLRLVTGEHNEAASGHEDGCTPRSQGGTPEVVMRTKMRRRCSASGQRDTSTEKKDRETGERSDKDTETQKHREAQRDTERKRYRVTQRDRPLSRPIG